VAINLKGRDFLSVDDLSQEELSEVLKASEEAKRKHKAGEVWQPLVGKSLALVFQKPSNRTRTSFEVGMWQLGGKAVYLSPQEVGLGKRETPADVARVLSRYVDCIVARTYAHGDLEEMARYASVPVINALSDYEHPCQCLGDLLTILEKKGRLKGLKLAYLGDGNNMAHSLIFGAAKTGLSIALATPPGYKPNPDVVEKAKSEASKTGSSVELTEDPMAAASGADALYTDVWASMGQEEEQEARAKVMRPYQLNGKVLSKAKKDVLVMHCLPAHRGEEITEDVIEGIHSVVFDQAENRLHTQKALLALIL
jgi:ornithine carbamoyltransferase